ncbi:hypothetical protein AT6N2_C3338 [Agrobacterium tumefaciens]|nr:hypothetical protein AT6N2_C3338 [Agrobacterium tumefaciens]
MKRRQTGIAQIIVQSAGSRVAAENVDRSGNGEGGDGHAAGQRFENGVAEGVRLGWENEDIGLGIGIGQVLTGLYAGEENIGIFFLQVVAGRAIANHHLGTRQIEVEKFRQVLLHRHTSYGHENRSRQVERQLGFRAGMEKFGVDAAAPAFQVAHAAGFQFGLEARGGHHAGVAAIVEPAHEGIKPAFRYGKARRHIFGKAGVVAGGKAHAVLHAPSPRHEAQRPFCRNMHEGRLAFFDLRRHAAITGDRQADFRIGGAGDAVETLRRHHTHVDAEPRKFGIGILNRANHAVDLRVPGICDNRDSRHEHRSCSFAHGRIPIARLPPVYGARVLQDHVRAVSAAPRG